VNKFLKSVANFLSISTVLLLLYLFGLTQNFGTSILDSYQGRFEASKEIVMVNIDENTISELSGLGKIEEWDIQVWYNAIQNLIKNNAEAIVFSPTLIPKTLPSRFDDFAKLIESNKKIYPLVSLSFNSDISQGVYEVIKGNSNFSEINFNENADLNLCDEDKVCRSTNLEFNTVNGFVKNISAELAGSFLGSSTVNLINTSKKFNIKYSDLNYTEINFLDLVQGKNLEMLSGKIVFINFNTSKAKLKLTPIKGVFVSNGYVTASVTQNLIENVYLQYLNPFIQIILICILIVFCLLIGAKLKQNIYLLASILLAVAIYFLGRFSFDYNIIIPAGEIIMSIALAYFSQLILQYLETLAQKKKIQQSFGKYLSPEIVKQLSENPDGIKLGGEKKTLTVLFTDIKGFTSISEKFPAEVVLKILNSYLTAMSEIIMQEGGTIDKYEGDAIMAIFGAPIALNPKDQAIKAAKSALRMKYALKSFNDTLPTLVSLDQSPANTQSNQSTNSTIPTPTLPTLTFRCGINLGEMIVGNIGHKNRLEYTVIGDNVNLASRLEGVNKKYSTQIMVSEDTAKLISDQFLIREIDLIRVVGRKQPVRIYELLAELTQTSEEIKSFITKYNQALELYYTRQFEQAYQEFLKLKSIYPDDGPIKLFVQRSEVMRNFPPKSDWDFVFEMTEK